MCRVRQILVGAVCLMASVSVALAARVSGGELLAECENLVHSAEAPDVPIDYYGAGLCVGYITGIVEMSGILGRRSPALFCLPAEDTPLLGIRVLVQYLRARPEKLDTDGIALVLEAFQAAFPCQEQQ
jgi:Rap1a immunity proteins